MDLNDVIALTIIRESMKFMNLDELHRVSGLLDGIVQNPTEAATAINSGLDDTARAAKTLKELVSGEINSRKWN